MADQTLVTKVEADASGFVNVLEHARGAFEGFLSGLSKGNLAGIGEGLASIAGAAGPLLGVAGAGLAIHEAFVKVEEAVAVTTAWNAEAVRLSRQLGITTQDASVLNETLKVMGVESGAYATAANFMTRALQNGSLGFKNLGIETRNNDGTFRNTNDLMQEAIEKLNAMPDGTQKNIIGQQLFGRGWLANRDILKVTSEALRETSEHMDRLGTKVTPESAAASRGYSIAMNELKATFEAFFIVLGNKLIPTLTEVAHWLSDAGTAAVQVFRGALDSIGVALTFVGQMFDAVSDAIGSLVKDIVGAFLPDLKSSWEWLTKVFGDIDLIGGFKRAITTVVAMFVTLVGVVQILWDVAVGAFSYMRDALFSVGTALVQAIHGDYRDAINTLKSGDAILAEDAAQTAGKVRKTWEDLESRVAKMQVTPFEDGNESAGLKTGNKTKGGDVETKNSGAKKLQEFKQQMEEMKAEEANFNAWDAAQEVLFWEVKLKEVRRGSEAEKLIRAEIDKAKVKAATEARAAAVKDTEAAIAEAQKEGDAKVQAIEKAEQKKLAALRGAADQEKAIAKNRIEVGKIVDPSNAGNLELKALQDEKVAEDALAADTARLRAKDLADEKAALEQKLLLQRLYFQQLRSDAAGNQVILAKIRKDEEKAVADTARAEAKLDENADIEVEKAKAASAKRELDLRLATNKKIATDQAELSKKIEGYLQPFVSGFTNGLKKMMDGTLSFSQAIQGLGQMIVSAFGDMITSIVSSWISSLAKMAAQWLANLVFQETTAKASDATRLATGIAARVAEASGMASVMAVAAGASVAAIPGVGWMMAPGVMAAAYEAGMAMAATAAAAGGFDVPSGMNPVTQLHAEEMVLPAPLANTVRAMAANSGGAAASMPSSSSQTIHIHAVDAKSFERMLRGSNGSAAINVAKDFMRNRRGGR